MISDSGSQPSPVPGDRLSPAALAVLVDDCRLFREGLAALLAERADTDVTLADALCSVTGILARATPDVVIAGVEDPWQDEVVNLSRSHPDLVVLGLGSDGRATRLYELVPWPHVLGALGPAELRSAVLAAVHATTVT